MAHFLLIQMCINLINHLVVLLAVSKQSKTLLLQTIPKEASHRPKAPSYDGISSLASAGKLLLFQAEADFPGEAKASGTPIHSTASRALGGVLATCVCTGPDIFVKLAKVRYFKSQLVKDLCFSTLNSLLSPHQGDESGPGYLGTPDEGKLSQGRVEFDFSGKCSCDLQTFLCYVMSSWVMMPSYIMASGPTVRMTSGNPPIVYWDRLPKFVTLRW